MRSKARVVAFVLIVASAWPAWAASPSLSVILPRGGQRGTTVEVTLHGGNLQDAAGLMFHKAGITAAEVVPEDDKKVKAKLTIAADCPLGPQPIRLRAKSGLTNMVLFSVGGLTEANEIEPNNDAAGAQALALGTTVNGVVSSEDIDYYAVELEKGARLAVEVEAIRLGTVLFDPKLRLFGPHGHELKTEDDTPFAQQDAAFTFTAEEAGKHCVAISEAAYGGAGNYYYRLHIGQFPRPLAVTPMAGAPGAAVELTWLGDPAVAAQSVTLPAGPAGLSCVPAQAEAGVSPTPIKFRLNDLTVTRETEPNNEVGQATAGAAPGSFDGVLQEPGDVDFFKFDGKKDQVLDVRLWGSAMGSPIDSLVTLLKPDGSALASDDDAAGLDSTFRATLPEDGAYTLSVQDHRKQGGPTYAYHVELRPVERRLEVRLLENEPACVAVPAGNQAFFLASLSRQDFDGPIKLEMPGLPAGVTAVADVIPAGQTTWPVVLTAAADAPVEGALAEVNGSLEPQEAENPLVGGLNQEVVLIYGNNKVVFVSEQVDRMAVAVTEAAPFSIEVAQPKVPLVRSGNMKLKVTAKRSEGFTAPIDLRIPWSPNGIGAGTAKIEEGQTETLISVDAQGNAPVGTAKLTVAASSAGYGVCSPFIALEVEEPWVTFEVPAVETEQGKPVEVVVKATQAKEYAGEYQAELLGLPKGVTAPPQTLSHGTTELKFPLEVAADAPEGKHQGLFVRTTLKAEEEEVLHQSGGGQLTVFKPLPPELQQPETPQEQPKQDETPRKTRFG